MTDFRNMTEEEIFQKGKIKEGYREVCNKLLDVSKRTLNGDIRTQFIAEFSDAKKEAYFGSKSATFDKLLRNNHAAFTLVLESFRSKVQTVEYDATSWSNLFDSAYSIRHGQRYAGVVANKDHFHEIVGDSFSANRIMLTAGHPDCKHWKPDPWKEQVSGYNNESKPTFKNYVTFRVFRECGESFLEDRARAIADFVYSYSLEDYQTDLTSRVVHEVRKLVANTGVPIVEVLRVLNNEFGEHLLKTVTET